MNHAAESVLDINQIKETLPHRYPFLLIDRVLELEEGKRILAVKQVTVNEPHFNGHFPVRPVMPGVLILEAMAQAAAILAKRSPGHNAGEGKEFFLAGASDVKWRKQVEPGDTLFIEVEWVKRKKNLLIIAGKALVNGNVVSSATIMAAEVDI